MDNSLAVVYLSVLVGILGFAVVSVFRQLFKTRKRESALSRLRSKLSKDKGTAQEYFELACIYSEKKVYTQAIPLFQKALKAAEEEGEENTAPIYNGLGYTYFAQEQYDLAIRQYKEALKFKPDYVVALNNLGHAYERKKLTAQALQMYEEALKCDPNNATAKRRAESLRRLVTA
ncbi:TPR repeat protein [Trichormus variabilis ATCC 29413]|uniref:TPR repeat protein n=2 Tax=Anabaena variabilis TaxID=264691 RepID=Q3M7H9_TRIV2|nr:MULTISPECIES: tetratricopeptide repeat protein [Nostocaceae]ABA23057.1 TPR repeat protein [Trichormus variabilis ATCC 29413]MBC1216055.1 tetratricopeptide repeat protein [Trichormus variabilis ARAD]MBC1254093.1 tetratricopeptide repeat protein [Trichormus variabilis V5]MBC1265679.1 tetratricopeptide repeat protein [Trichormus variabilis FSR]MBC1303189.1 tetratricopeptide repeat protein [Trichormus variabilis N2B]